MALEHFAWRIAGPIDAAINLAINTLIPWYFLYGVSTVPLVGLPSLYAFLGPMVFCVLLIASAMGYRNGIRFLAGTRQVPGWRWRAWSRGLALAVGGSAVLGLAIVLFDRWQPQLRIAATSAIAIDGLGSAAIAYFAHVGGVFAAGRFVRANPAAV